VKRKVKQAAQKTITLINAETGLGRRKKMVLGKRFQFQFRVLYNMQITRLNVQQCCVFSVVLNANSQNRVVLILFFPTTQQEQIIPKICVCRQISTTERRAAVASKITEHLKHNLYDDIVRKNVYEEATNYRIDNNLQQQNFHTSRQLSKRPFLYI
jgi:hypothetical protein